MNTLKKGNPKISWWEQQTKKNLLQNKPPWGDNEIVPFESNDGSFSFTITKEMLNEYSEETPNGRNILQSFSKYKEIGKLAIAGIRYSMNITDIHDTRQVKNSFERFLTTLSLGLMIKIKYQKKHHFPFQVNYGHEVRYFSEEFQEITARTLASLGFVIHTFPNNQPTAIWNTSTMGKFFCLPLSFCGTASHSESIMDGLKIMDHEGSQFMISSINAMIKIQEAIINKIKKDGQIKFTIAPRNDPRITSQLYDLTNNGMYVYRKYQMKTAVDNFTLNLIRSGDFSGVSVDCMHGSAYKTLCNFFDEMDLVKTKEKINWIHTEGRPDFGNIGKFLENPNAGEDGLFDAGADITQVYERVTPENQIQKYFPILLSANYPELLADMNMNSVILHTDPDNDRLNVTQILPNTNEKKEILSELGVYFNEINDKKILACFIPNKFFHMLHEINFERIQSLMKMGKLDNNRTILVLKSYASTPSVDQWVSERQKEGYDIKLINTAVGFSKLANVMYKIESRMKKQPGEDVIIADASGKKINVGQNPLILTAWEESGGIIFGITYGFKDMLGRSFLAMREKSATESIFFSLALLSKIRKEKGEIDLAEYLKEIYKRDNVTTPIDILVNNKLFTPGIDAEAQHQEKIGNQRKNRVFGFYLSLVFAYRNKEIDIATVREILQNFFKSEYKYRENENELEKVLLNRLKNIDFSHLQNLEFTGDGIFFRFENKGSKWSVLFRPSGTEPKLKAYGFGSSTEEVSALAWAFAYNENRSSELPEVFQDNLELMKYYGANGKKVIAKARRMLNAWEEYGITIDPESEEELKKAGLTRDKLTKMNFREDFKVPDNHLELVNNWLEEENLGKLKIDLSTQPAYPEEDLEELMDCIPDEVYEMLGREK